MNQRYRNIVYKVEDGVANIIIDKPPLNVLDSGAIEEIASALTAADADIKVFAVVITGGGDRAFSAGVDVSAHLPDKIEETLHKFHKVFHKMADLRKPVIAKVNGFALGGGCELALACDIAVASEKARFGQPEIKVGAIPTVAAALLPRLIRRRQAFELIFTGDTISAEEANRKGLVNMVVPHDKLSEAVDELLDKLRAKSPIVLQLVKWAVCQGIDSDFKTALNGVTEIYLNHLIKTEDAVEGLKAFLEKRAPKWKGK